MPNLIVVGERSAGKGTLAKYCKAEYGLEQIVFSEVLAEIGLRENLITEEMLQKDRKGTLANLGKKLRDEKGSDYHTGFVLEKASAYEACIFDGMRDHRELELIRQRYPDAKLIGIEANPLLRYFRSYNAGVTTGPYHFFMELERKPTEREIRSLIERADARFRNNFGLNHFYKDIDRLMENYGIRRVIKA